MKQTAAVICHFVTILLIASTASAAKSRESQLYSDVKLRVVTIISQKTGLPESKISEDMSFVRDLKMDQRTHEAVREALSQEVGFKISDESAEKITTVQRAINYVFIRQQ